MLAKLRERAQDLIDWLVEGPKPPLNPVRVAAQLLHENGHEGTTTHSWVPGFDRFLMIVVPPQVDEEEDPYRPRVPVAYAAVAVRESYDEWPLAPHEVGMALERVEKLREENPGVLVQGAIVTNGKGYRQDLEGGHVHVLEVREWAAGPIYVAVAAWILASRRLR